MGLQEVCTRLKQSHQKEEYRRSHQQVAHHETAYSILGGKQIKCAMRLVSPSNMFSSCNRRCKLVCFVQ